MRGTDEIFAEACAVFEQGEEAFRRGDHSAHARLRARHRELEEEHRRAAARGEAGRGAALPPWFNFLALACSLLVLIFVLTHR